MEITGAEHIAFEVFNVVFRNLSVALRSCQKQYNEQIQARCNPKVLVNSKSIYNQTTFAIAQCRNGQIQYLKNILWLAVDYSRCLFKILPTRTKNCACELFCSESFCSLLSFQLPGQHT